jgi:predicted O-methyltransferase YrrM
MDQLVERMVALHGVGIIKRSALRIGDGARVLTEMLAELRPRVILEIGTYRGCTAAYMAQFCERVITVDLVHGLLERGGEAFDRHAFWRSLGADNIDLHLADAEAAKARLIERLHFDFAFIDGAHDFDSVRADFELVKRCGRVLFHDYDPAARPQKNGVHALVRTLPAGQVSVRGIFALWID